jgi:hypothetical protein
MGLGATAHNPLTHTDFLFCVIAQWGLPGAGTYVTPSLNHSGCVISLPAESFLSFLARRIALLI